MLLQSATAILLQSATSVITKCDRYYNVWQFYYKVRQISQSTMIITKCDRTLSHRRSTTVSLETNPLYSEDENRQLRQLEGVLLIEHLILLTNLQGTVWLFEGKTVIEILGDKGLNWICN